MMWGPAVARAAADVALHGRSSVVDTTDLGLDRFDEHGNSRLATDPIALPFPEKTPQVLAFPEKTPQALAFPEKAQSRQP